MTIPLDGPRIAPASGGAPGSIVILIHGYGSNGEDLIGLAPYWRAALPHTLFVSPNAPYPCPGAPGGFQWWSVGGGDRSSGLKAAAPILDAFIDGELARHGLSDGNLALVGFSQGTMLALHVGPRRPRRIAGIVGFSGMLIDDPADPPATRPPVLLIHGDADPMIPIAAFHHARDGLARQGFELTTHVSPG
ncbi:MAG TPA: alpha/beta fold hydrolase, partial [Caulobacteraceae bacterium]|nr:alpha/beta fold hydrolase [Caulobacteraceae bacterium]